MTKVPVVHYEQATETLRIIIPAHRPIKRSTFAYILKQAKLSVDQFKALA